jgi:peptidoglycan-associated lipoprotein
MRKTAFLLALLMEATTAQAQLPFLTKRGAQPQQSLAPPIDALRAEFAAQAGGTTVYYGNGSSALAAPARAALALQAAWLRRHPEIVVRVEGYGDSLDTRSHALALGARRAAEVRSYLVLLGVPSAQVSTTSWGKERPGLGRAVTILVR